MILNFDGRAVDGTLLLSASYQNYHQYCDLLLSDGFDCQRMSRNASFPYSPYSIAQRENFLYIVALMEVKF